MAAAARFLQAKNGELQKNTVLTPTIQYSVHSPQQQQQQQHYYSSPKNKAAH
jgi:hypothetical protein